MILLAVEEKMTAPQIAKIVRQNEQTVRRWIQRFNAEGITGLSDEPKSGAPKQVTDGYRERLLGVVRRRPRSLEQPYSLVDFAAIGKLHGRRNRFTLFNRNGAPDSESQRHCYQSPTTQSQ